MTEWMEGRGSEVLIRNSIYCDRWPIDPTAPPRNVQTERLRIDWGCGECLHFSEHWKSMEISFNPEHGVLCMR